MTGGSTSFIANCPSKNVAMVLLMNQQDLKFSLTNSGMKVIEDLLNQSIELQEILDSNRLDTHDTESSEKTSKQTDTDQ